MDYGAFVDGKLSRLSASGISGHVDLPESLFGHQAALTRWALKRGRAAVFADTGLGKTRIELAFGAEVSRYTQKPFLILCPLAVAAQTAAEGASIGIGVTICRDGEDVRPGVNVTNYDRLHRFDCSIFGGVSPDESSVIKHHDERHICPLQLEVIRRGVALWTNPDDIVLSPFMGIGSEGYVSLEMGRRFVGVELKESYFKQATANLEGATRQTQGLFA